MLLDKIMLFSTKLQKYFVFLTISIITYNVVIHFNSKNAVENCFPEYLNKYFNFDVKIVGMNTSLDVGKLRANINLLNKEREVRNVIDYGPVTTETPFLVILVHRGLERLRHLIAALTQVAGIDDILLVFSHSYYDHRINHLINQIDFCMVLQIFYPNSVQLNPHLFPSFDATEFVNGSTNGSLRDPRLTEPKHHWWWTVNFVFDRLVWQQLHTDMVTFIDENSYVLPDLFFMLGSAKNALRYFPVAEVISLGRAPSGFGEDRLTLEAWQGAHGNGLTFNRSTWEKISILSWYYCEYDDTSWSHSLEHLFRQFPGGSVVAVSLMAPRVLPATETPRDLCYLAKQSNLFPEFIEAVVLYGRDGMVLPAPEVPPKGNGGWNNYHDVIYCYETIIAEEKATSSNST